MILKSLNKYISFFIFCLIIFPVNAEEQIDIWNKKKKDTSEIIKSDKKITPSVNSELFKRKKVISNIEIKDDTLNISESIKIFGVYDPAENDFNLNMWSQTNADDVRSSIKRINKIDLSATAMNLFENTLFSFAYPPNGMDDKEFIDLKIDWMINNERSELIEKFLKQNKSFHNKKKAIQYLVDENISKANIKEGCEKVNFFDKSIRDSYLEKFKIYCLIFENKKNEAQLLYDILKEGGQSDKFFDDKIMFLLGISNKTSEKTKDDNLLYFYLSSITIENFKYEPNKKTKKIIWDYLNAANLIEFDDITDKDKLKSLEVAANKDQFDKKRIFAIYKRLPFDLNSLINADSIYQTLDSTDSRALIYQRFLLSDDIEKKIQLLFLLENLFKKDDLSNIFAEFMIDKLKELDSKNIPKSYKEIVEKKINSREGTKLGKIKYDDKILHQSRVIKYYTESVNQKKTQKDFLKIYKKIRKNKKYFFSAKDLALVESLVSDGFDIPEEMTNKKDADKYVVPSNLLELVKNNEPAFLTLKIVEILGEDEPHNLDPETVYFITHLLNQTKLKRLRNEILISALPQRI